MRASDARADDVFVEPAAPDRGVMLRENERRHVVNGEDMTRATAPRRHDESRRMQNVDAQRPEQERLEKLLENETDDARPTTDRQDAEARWQLPFAGKAGAIFHVDEQEKFRVRL